MRLRRTLVKIQSAWLSVASCSYIFRSCHTVDCGCRTTWQNEGKSLACECVCVYVCVFICTRKHTVIKKVARSCPNVASIYTCTIKTEEKLNLTATELNNNCRDCQKVSFDCCLQSTVFILISKEFPTVGAEKKGKTTASSKKESPLLAVDVSLKN